MSLSDLMSGARLATYPEIALVLFMAVFVSVAVSLIRARNRDTWERARRMPLRDEEES